MLTMLLVAVIPSISVNMYRAEKKMYNCSRLRPKPNLADTTTNIIANAKIVYDRSCTFLFYYLLKNIYNLLTTWGSSSMCIISSTGIEMDDDWRKRKRVMKIWNPSTIVCLSSFRFRYAHNFLSQSIGRVLLTHKINKEHKLISFERQPR